MARKPRAPLVPEVEPQGLTRQQREIWRLAREGKTSKEIAAAVGTSHEMVRLQLHRMRILLSRGVNKVTRPVSYALNPVEEDVQAELVSAAATMQEKVEILSRTGKYSDREIAERIGSTHGAVRVMKSRMKNHLPRRARVIRRWAAQGDTKTTVTSAPADLGLLSRLAYEAFVAGDPRSPQTMQARRLLAALGAGGPGVRRLAFSDRAKDLRKLLNQRSRPMRVLSRATAAMVRDVIEAEFVPLDNLIFKPRRASSWEVLRTAVKKRFLAVAERLVSVEPAGSLEGLPLYQVNASEEVAVAVRATAQGFKVAPAAKSTNNIQPKIGAEGTVVRVGGGLVRIATPEGTMLENPVAGLVVSRRGFSWAVADGGLLEPGDEVRVMADGRLEAKKTKGLEIVVMGAVEIAFVVAWCVIGERCWIEVNGMCGSGRWRCEPPLHRVVASIDVSSLELGSELAKDDGEVVKVRPHGDRYQVVMGAKKVAEAIAAGAEEILVIVEQPVGGLSCG